MSQPRTMTKTAKVFLLVMSVEALVLFSFGLFLLIQTLMGKCINALGESVSCSEDYATSFAIVFLLSCIYFVYVGIVMIRRENHLQLYLFFAATCLVTAYAFFRFFSSASNLAASITILVTALLGQITIPFLLYRLHSEFGFRYLDAVGTNNRFREMFQRLEIFIGLIQYDLYMSIVLIVMAGLLIPDTDVTLGLSIGMVVLSFLFAFLGYFALRREMKRGIWVFFFFMIIEPAYIFYKIIRIFFVSQYAEVPKPPLVIQGAVAFITRILVLYFAIRSYQNFGKGLKRVLDLTDRERKHAASQAFSDVTEKIYDNQEGEYPSPYVAAVP